MGAGISRKAQQFSESVIREMTRQAQAHGAINLAQGFPDFEPPPEVRAAAVDALRGGVHQYAITWGARNLRQAIAERARRHQGLDFDPETEITVTCGATEAMIATMMALVDPGDEVVIFEPFYENYGPDAVLSGAVPRFVPLRPPDWRFDPDELARAFNARTRAIVLNTPNNPTGKVFDRDELACIAALCDQWDALAFTDEIYQHILYDGARHVSMATLPGMRQRTVTIDSLSKTYAVTGWRVGWAQAAPELTAGIRKVHDFLTVGAPAPLQEAGVRALALPESYYTGLATAYRERRDFMVAALGQAGFRCWVPRGAYYIMTDVSDLGFADDVACAEYLVREVGVATVPGSSFYREPGAGSQQVRVCFPKRLETLREAARRLQTLAARRAPGAAPAAPPPAGSRPAAPGPRPGA
jgi:aminotransferase